MKSCFKCQLHSPLTNRIPLCPPVQQTLLGIPCVLPLGSSSALPKSELDVDGRENLFPFLTTVNADKNEYCLLMIFIFTCTGTLNALYNKNNSHSIWQ